MFLHIPTSPYLFHPSLLHIQQCHSLIALLLPVDQGPHLIPPTHSECSHSLYYSLLSSLPGK